MSEENIVEISLIKENCRLLCESVHIYMCMLHLINCLSFISTAKSPYSTAMCCSRCHRTMLRLLYFFVFVTFNNFSLFSFPSLFIITYFFVYNEFYPLDNNKKEWENSYLTRNFCLKKKYISGETQDKY